MLSTLGSIPEDFDFEFDPVAEPTDKERADLAKCGTDNVVAAFNAGLISQRTALQELKQQSERTGVWTNITDEDIEKASAEVEQPGEMGAMPGMPPMGGDENGPDAPTAPAGGGENAEQARAPVRRVKSSDMAFWGEVTDYDPNPNRGQPENAGWFAEKGRESTKRNDLSGEGKRVKLSPRGKNKFLVRDFINQERREYHINKHLHESALAGLSEEEYIQKGIELLESEVTPGGIRGYLEPGGTTIVRYDPKRQWYAVGNPNDGMWSFYSMSPKKFEERYRRAVHYGKH